MNFAFYMLGVLFVIAALAYGAHVPGVGTMWILIGVLFVFGLGLMAGIVRTGRKNPPYSASQAGVASDATPGRPSRRRSTRRLETAITYNRRDRRGHAARHAGQPSR
jgi:hypothetical protein